MAKISSKKYDEQVSKLENMADGAKKHVDNPKISATINETEYRDKKTGIEGLRENYITKEKEAREAYDRFAAKYSENTKSLGKSGRIAKGILGRHSETLRDFGITPEKRSRAKKKPNNNPE